MSRIIALKIATASSKDQEWILSRMSESERTFLCPLLDEIKALQLDKDPNILALMTTTPNQIKKVIDSSALSGIQNMHQLNTFWQRMVLGCVKENDRESIIRKNQLTITQDDSISAIPQMMKLNLIQDLKTSTSDRV